MCIRDRPSITLAIYRVVQESLINALRHARASRIDIVVQGDSQRVRISVTDDGVGLPTDWARPGHFGLRGLADRAAQLGGTLQVGNRNEGGVMLSAEIPLMVTA